ncbi:hypothetical protein [Sorangium sp. So ce887]|uniref:hypothetical protein n=1 Tax=Sorangium sp. So ce887 TaxID=3133324 RepID=UPI003F5DD93E
MPEVELFRSGQADAFARRIASCSDDRYTPERRAYFVEFLRHGPSGLMDNGRSTRAFMAVVGDALVPLVVNDGDVDDCYLVSTRCHYILYMMFEMSKIRPRWKTWPLQRAVGLLGRVVTRAGFNRCVSINNWLLTTSPQNQLTRDELATLTAGLCRLFPEHALVMRAVDPREITAEAVIAACGYRLIAHRPVHEWDPTRIARLSANQRAAVRKDLALFHDGPFSVREPKELAPAEAQRVAWLYHALYIGKHSRLNACFNAGFFHAVTSTGMSPIALLERKDTGELVAFVTYFEDPGRLVSSLVGYDPQLPRNSFPCYRMALAFTFRLSIERRKPLFLSTGAASIKRRRGSYEWMEHEAYFVQHLPRTRQLAWDAMAALLNLAAARLDTSQI